MKKTNGWLRLWLVFGMISFVPTTYYFYTPITEKDIQEKLRSESSADFSEYLQEQDGIKAACALSFGCDARKNEPHFQKQWEELRQRDRERTIKAMNEIENLGNVNGQLFLKAAFYWALIMFALYAGGLTVKWIAAGFTEKDTQ